MLNGHRAFDNLFRAGFMEVGYNDGWGRIHKLPLNQRDLDFIVRMVKYMGAWSGDTPARPAQIQIRVVVPDPDELNFRKIEPEAAR